MLEGGLPLVPGGWPISSQRLPVTTGGRGSYVSFRQPLTHAPVDGALSRGAPSISAEVQSGPLFVAGVG